MNSRYSGLALLAALVFAPAASAHPPGENLDEILGSKERYFQAVDVPARSFRLADPDGTTVTLADLSDKVVVLNFIYASCPDVCPLHAEVLADIQAMINQTPMKDLVQFISITTDPTNDTPDVLKAYGPVHGLDPGNWTFLTVKPGQAENATRELAEAFGHKFITTGNGYQTHGVVTHVIDRDGRWAANFHGLRFEPLNMVLYVNGLINKPHAAGKKPEPGWWERLKRLFQ